VWNVWKGCTYMGSYVCGSVLIRTILPIVLVWHVGRSVQLVWMSMNVHNV
jgi:hypothetical protein